MEGILFLILITLVIFIFVIPLVAISVARRAEKSAQQSQAQIRHLENQLRLLRTEQASTPPRDGHPLPIQKAFPPESAGRDPMQPPPLRVIENAPAPPVPTPMPDPPKETPGTAEPISPELISAPSPSTSKPAEFSIEQFLGVRLFAWLGGAALFFGIIFFIKYAFEHNLIPPAMRVGIGFVTGISLLTGGWITHRKERYRVLAQAFCATGILILYGATFAAHAVYQLPWFSDISTFALMGAVTAAAIWTAIRKDALVVAVLGMLGGFITPLLLPMVQDHPAALFGYVALLDIGLLALVVRGKWSGLSTGAALGTIAMILMWAIKFFLRERYHIGSATLVPMGILLGFTGLFLAAAWQSTRTGKPSTSALTSSFLLLLTALGFGFVFLAFHQIGNRAPLLYGFMLLINLAAITLARLHRGFAFASILTASATFLHIAAWTVEYLDPEKLPTALVIQFLFGLLHTLAPMLATRIKSDQTLPAAKGILTPWICPLVLCLMSLTLITLDDVDFVLWPAILATNLLCFVSCARSGSLLPVLASIGVTILTAVIWMVDMPEVSSALHSLLGIVLAFAVFFAAGGFWLARSFAKHGVEHANRPKDLIPLVAAAMPFFLLILTVVHLEIPNPSSVFATALALIAVFSVTALWTKQAILLPVVLVLNFLLLGFWHTHHFDASDPNPALLWMLGFYGLFTALPFVARRACDSTQAPWIASALSGPIHFLLIHNLIQRAFPNEFMGLLPAAFALPSIGLLALEWRRNTPHEEPGKTRLAWFGAVSLFFITLIFPIQLDRQWLTLAWALEGAALIWLFRHIPHRGLIATGCGLLTTAFIRLGLNPSLFLDYERSGTPILNWHLYVYGIAGLSMLAAAHWFPKSPATPIHRSAKAILQVFSGILFFLLLNIEIADFFTEPGSRFIAFEFSGNFGRDMSYTIGWSLFALALLILGIIRGNKGTRYAAIGLLATALLKLFLHDLANIESIYRIAALLCTGVIAFIASFLYQRFVPSDPDGREMNTG